MGTGVGEAMLISAATGGGMAAVTGGDPLKGALLGAVTGGVGHGIAGATAAGGANAATSLPSTGAEAAQAANLAANLEGVLYQDYRGQQQVIYQAWRGRTTFWRCKFGSQAILLTNRSGRC
jgi:hypothetical protein